MPTFFRAKTKFTSRDYLYKKLQDSNDLELATTQQQSQDPHA